jgi:DNA helicase-2/ATP-dependent DNA helicase PcrA
VLDGDQRVAASIVDGPLLIMAGPGSGKTRTLTHRIAHLIAERGAAPAECLAITFTRRAASEMRERLAHLLPAVGERVPIHTFHSLGLSILREHPDAAGLHRGFRIADEPERIAALAAALGVTEVRAQRLLHAISKAKRTHNASDLDDAMAAYAHVLAVNNWIDFDDVIGLALRVLTAAGSGEGLAPLYRERFRWISVDEFQDVDEQQYRLLAALAPPRGNLCVIGDADQAIYGFRGADSSCFERFKRDYRPAVVTLRRNYRSSGTIVTASSQMISGTRDEPLAAIVRDMHERITIHAAATERAEAEFVVQTIEQAIGGHSFFSIDSGRATGAATGLSFADFAVLYRTDAQSAALAEAFARSGIPFRQHSHGALAEEPAVRALMAALDQSGQPLADQLRTAAARLAGKGNPFDSTAVQAALDRLSALGDGTGTDLARFRDAVAAASEADFWDARADCVSLLTLHAAKGLEFAHVFILGLEDGLLPLYWGEPDDAELAEERRLFYVGMTRAKDRLVLSRALSRQWRGRVRQLPPSRFLARIEDELVKHQRTQGLRRKPEDLQLKLF